MDLQYFYDKIIDELEKQMEDLALKVPDPINIRKIKTH